MNDSINIELDEGQRQATLMALAHLAVERPGWDYMLTEIARKMDNADLAMYQQFKHLHSLRVGMPSNPALPLP